MHHVPTLIVVTALAALAFASAADDPSTSPIQAILSTTYIDATGSTYLAPHAATAFIAQSLGQEAWSGHWTLSAPEAVVNWTRVTQKAVAQSPTQADASLLQHKTESAAYGEDAYTNASIAAIPSGAQGAFMAIPLPAGPAPELEGLRLRAAHMEPSRSEVWAVGAFSNQTLTNDPDSLLRATHAVRPGMMVVEGVGEAEVRLRGDFVVVAWEINVTVESARPDVTYPSGKWWNNATLDVANERGVARDEHLQLLQIRVRNATLHVVSSAGQLDWTAPAMELSTTGLVEYENANGWVETPQWRHVATEDDISLQGEVFQQIAASHDSRLVADVDAQRGVAYGFTPPQRPPESGHPFLWEGSFVKVWAVGAGLAVALVVVGSRWWTRRVGWRLAQLDRAHDDLERGAHAPALRRARRVLGRDAGNKWAWLVYAQARRELDGPKALVDDLGQAVKPVQHGAGVALLLAESCIELGDEVTALKWLQVARRDPEFSTVIDGQPKLQALFDRLREKGTSAAAYA